MIYERIVSPALELFPSEGMQTAAKKSLALLQRMGPPGRQTLRLISGWPEDDPRLAVSVAGLELRNPVIVGAGWDKAGEAVRALSWMGFAGVEVGTVTEHAQPGNPKPRQWVIGPGVALNRLGFNGPGMEVVGTRLARYADVDDTVIGLNVGKNREVPAEQAPHKHAVVVRRLCGLADYITINLASPNTPGLRALLAREHLTPIIQAVQDALAQQGQTAKPVFVKISPDMSPVELDEVLDVCLGLGVAGIVASNTTVREDLKARYGERWRDAAGGLSGNDPDYRAMVNAQVRHIRRSTGGALPIIGVGGVDSAAAALEKILAGASLVQVVTGIRGRGPGVAWRINAGLAAWMEQQGVRSLAEMVGAGDQV